MHVRTASKTFPFTMTANGTSAEGIDCPMWDIMDSGVIGVQHEVLQTRMSWRPYQHFRPMIQWMQGNQYRHMRHMLIKSRRMGATTTFIAMALLMMEMSPAMDIQFINWKKELGDQLLRQLGGFMVKNSPMFSNMKHTTGKITREHREGDSIIENLISARGSGGAMAHITDFGKMTIETPIKAREALSGTIEAINHGLIVVESTTSGATGQLKDEAFKVMERQEAGIPPGPKDFMLWFVPWFAKASNSYAVPEGLEEYPPELMNYFEGLAMKDIKLTPEQMYWYFQTWNNWPFDRKLEEMWEEHPSTIQEAFSVDMDKYILGREMYRVRERNRITDAPAATPDDSEVYVGFDIGKTDWTCMTFVQMTDWGPRVVDFYRNRNQMLDHYTDILHRKGYNYALLILPHDGGHANTDTAKAMRQDTLQPLSHKQNLNKLGFNNVIVLDRPRSKGANFDMAKKFCGKCFFYEPTTKTLVDHLKAARRKEIDGMITDLLAKTEASHSYDSFETLAVYFESQSKQSAKEIDIAQRLLTASNSSFRGGVVF